MIAVFSTTGGVNIKWALWWTMNHLYSCLALSLYNARSNPHLHPNITDIYNATSTPPLERYIICARPQIAGFLVYIGLLNFTHVVHTVISASMDLASFPLFVFGEALIMSQTSNLNGWVIFSNFTGSVADRWRTDSLFPTLQAGNLIATHGPAAATVPDRPAILIADCAVYVPGRLRQLFMPQQVRTEFAVFHKDKWTTVRIFTWCSVENRTWNAI